MARKLPNLLDAWNEFTQYLPSHPLFKEWAGIFLIGATLTRRVWIHADPTMPFLYPNVWVLLVGAPATGKDMAINRVLELLEDAAEGLEKEQQFYLGEESLSAKGLVDSLASDEAQQSFKYVNGSRKEEVVIFHSIIGCIPELGTFIPEYSTQQISILNDLYNCKRHFRDRIRGGIRKGQRVDITNPHATFFLGTQPETLATIFPEQAWRMGFFSRTIIVYGDKPIRQDIYDKSRPPRKRLWSKITQDIQSITQLVGEMEVAPEVQQAINQFHKVDCDNTALAHSRFKDYNTRRSFHLQKLALIFSIAEGDTMIVEYRHWEQAKEVLLRTEKQMPGAFCNLVSSSGFSSTVEEITAGKDGEVITHRDLERQLRLRHKPYEIGAIMKNMQSARDLVMLDKADQYGMPTYQITEKGKELLK